DYEAAQDSVGQWFADQGLVRGERRAAAIREARQNGEEPPKRRYHAKTWKWRVKEELRLKAEAKALEAREVVLDDRTARVTEREEEAETVLAVAEGVAAGAFEAREDGSESGLVDAIRPSASATPTLTLEDLRKRSPDGVARASGVFARAWQ
ncbi:hypothetical protein GZH79_18585, partial [Loktanella sp. SALINAS62]|nr:hypothetical protein [Loktanella sp. SALINAS62]